MSGAIALLQRNSAHILVDAGSYFEDGTVAFFMDKCLALPAQRCAVTTHGIARWQDIIFDVVQEFNSFDAMKAGISPLLKQVFEDHHDTISTRSRRECCVWVVGWSEQQQRPEGFTIFLQDQAEWEADHAGKITDSLPRPFQVCPIGFAGLNLTFSPCPTRAQIVEAGFPIPLSETEKLNPEIDLLQLMEVQRRTLFARTGTFCIGGYALLTSVTERGVTQRKIHEWTEDEVGEQIKPGPIDWVNWRAERDPKAGVPIALFHFLPSSLSHVQFRIVIERGRRFRHSRRDEDVALLLRRNGHASLEGSG